MHGVHMNVVNHAIWRNRSWLVSIGLCKWLVAG